MSETKPARAERGEGEALHPCRFVRKESGLHGSAQTDHRRSQLSTGRLEKTPRLSEARLLTRRRRLPEPARRPRGRLSGLTRFRRRGGFSLLLH